MKIALLGLLLVPAFAWADLVCSISEESKNPTDYVKRTALHNGQATLALTARTVEGVKVEVSASTTRAGQLQLSLELSDSKLGTRNVTALPAPSEFITHAYMRGEESLGVVCGVKK